MLSIISTLVLGNVVMNNFYTVDALSLGDWLTLCSFVGILPFINFKNRCPKEEIVFFFSVKNFVLFCWYGYITYGMRARVETIGPIWVQNAPKYFVLGTNYWILLCDNRNQQVHIVLQHRYLKMCQIRIFIDHVFV